MNFKAKPVARAVRQAGKGVVRPEAMRNENPSCRLVQTGAGRANLRRFEHRLLGFPLYGPDAENSGFGSSST